MNFGTEHTLIAVRESSGFGVGATDEEILRGQREIASREGIFTEVSSATALASISRALQDGRIQRTDKVLAILTGSGFKDYYPAFKDISSVPLAESFEKIPEILKAKYAV